MHQFNSQKILGFSLLSFYSARLLALVSLLVVSETSLSMTECKEKIKYRFGIVPLASAGIMEVWGKNIEQAVAGDCIEFNFHSAKNFRDYLLKAESGAFDFFVSPPHLASYLIQKEASRAVGELVWESNYLILASTDSGIASVNDSSIKSISLPDEFSEVSILVKKQFSSRLDGVQYQYHRNMMDITDSLIGGSVQVGVLLEPFYLLREKQLKSKVKVLQKNPFPSEGLFLSRSGIDKSDHIKVFDALNRMGPEAKMLWRELRKVSDTDISRMHDIQKETVSELEFMLNTLSSNY